MTDRVETQCDRVETQCDRELRHSVTELRHRELRHNVTVETQSDKVETWSDRQTELRHRVTDRGQEREGPSEPTMHLMQMAWRRWSNTTVPG